MAKQARVFLAAAGVAATMAFPAVASAQAPRSVTVNLATQNASGVSGTATLTDMGGGRTRVVVRVATGGNNAMPAHIHDGTCATLNPTPKFPLNMVTNGTSTSDVNASLSSLLAGPVAINLHKSAAQASVYTACGNIVAGAVALPRTGGYGSFTVPLLAGAGAALAGIGGLIARRRGHK